jgi:small subunit ribosomal protein S8
MITTTDPISDMLTRIRNAIMVRKHTVQMPHSKAKEAVAQILKDNNFIDSIAVEDAPVGKTLIVTITGENQNARITEITRVSKPGRRYYVRSGEIPTVKRGRGIVVVSTSKGLLTGEEAKKQGVGGEIVCRIY